MIEVFDEKDVEECLSEVKDSNIKTYAFCLLDWAVQKRKIQAIPIPERVTNGDMIKAIFPNVIIEIKYNTIVTNIDNGCWFSLNWWDAPYEEKRGREE